MSAVRFSAKELRFLNYMRVGRLGTTDGKAIHLVPLCPVFDGTAFYMATHAKTRKVKNLRKNNQATLLVDQYSDDWMRHVATMMTGAVEIIEKGSEFVGLLRIIQVSFQFKRNCCEWRRQRVISSAPPLCQYE